VVTSGYRSVAVEMKDGIVVLDAPVGGIEAAIAQIHMAIPNKPITHVVLSHMHFDHVAGLRTLLADGPKPITVVTHEMNKDVVEQWFANPHTLNTTTPAGGVPPVPGAAPAGGRGGNAAPYPWPDALAKSGKKVKFSYVKGDKMVIKDSVNTIEIYPIHGAVHSEDMMVVYLPKAKAVYQADAWNPVAPNTLTAGLGQRAFQKLLANELDRLKLDYTIVVSGHAPNDGRDASKQDLMVASGITPPAAGAAGGGQRQ
jgi:glyoxylase-like metal-dependent hydrolase (beta-lactamase superfamily II)